MSLNDKQVIVFYKDKDEVIGIKGQHLDPKMSMEDFNKHVKAFEKKDIHCLIAPDTLVTGWRCKVPYYGVIVAFIGKGWTDMEIAQGQRRTMSSTLSRKS